MKPQTFLTALFLIAAPAASFADEATEACTACTTEITAEHKKEVACPLDQDRLAILNMAGTFKVTFHFQETVAAQPGYKLKDAYHEQATELIKVVEDSSKTIRMQHILVVNRGPKKDPIVVKHWRQDWTYQDNAVFGYRGRDTWQREDHSTEEIQGTWSQAVYQTDDSPRYEAIGQWVHEGDQSYWESSRTWRPLPRREHSKRKDYDVLAVRNRHTITPTGWVHEQDNRKVVLSDEGTPTQIIAHEIGVNTYERVGDEGFDAALTYWQATEDYWADVRAEWDKTFASNQVIKIEQKNEDGRLRESLTDLAEDVELSGEYTPITKAKAVATIAHHVQ